MSTDPGSNTDGYGPWAAPMPLEDTEYGGGPGLIQGVGRVPGAGRLEVTPAERLGMAYRTKDDDPDAIDPATGLPATTFDQ